MENLNTFSLTADELQRLAAMLNNLPPVEQPVDGQQTGRPDKLCEPTGDFVISNQDILEDLLRNNQDKPEAVERLRRDFAAGKIKL